jgi:hypothetical protein
MKTKPFIIGIDGGRKTGVAVFCRASKSFVSIETLDFWKAHDYILANFTPETAEIVIEKLNERAALYARTSNKARDKIAANVGSVRRETSLLIERFISKGFTVRTPAPVRAAKWTAKDLKRFTGWTKQTSEHGRDAARIIFYG